MSPLPELNKQSPIAILAAGRLGSSLAIALTNAGYNVAAVTSRRADQRKWLAGQLPDSVIVDNLQTASNVANIVFITGPDAAVEEICNQVEWRSHQAVVHCAGVLPVSALHSASDSGAAIAGFHPLQTFPSNESHDRLADVSFATEASNRDLYKWLEALATDLDGSTFPIEPSQRAAYHASGVMACGMVAGWIGVAAEMWQVLGINREEALKRLIPLMRATIDALDERGLPNAITGPFVRGDVDTIAAHHAAAQSKSKETGTAYAALALASLHIAKEQGGLSDSAFQRIQSLLSNENQT